jgi:hypothetical protein
MDQTPAIVVSLCQLHSHGFIARFFLLHECQNRIDVTIMRCSKDIHGISARTFGSIAITQATMSWNQQEKEKAQELGKLEPMLKHVVLRVCSGPVLINRIMSNVSSSWKLRKSFWFYESFLLDKFSVGKTADVMKTRLKLCVPDCYARILKKSRPVIEGFDGSPLFQLCPSKMS